MISQPIVPEFAGRWANGGMGPEVGVMGALGGMDWNGLDLERSAFGAFLRLGSTDRYRQASRVEFQFERLFLSVEISCLLLGRE